MKTNNRITISMEAHCTVVRAQISTQLVRNSLVCYISTNKTNLSLSSTSLSSKVRVTA